MKSIDIEDWALGIIERVEAKQPIEDLRVELKAAWPVKHHKAARQIAAHANAARGEPILWLFGVDEQKGVTGVDYNEISNWHQAVKAKFDAISPHLTHLNVPYQGKTVVALLWETDRSPFLVKNPDGGTVALEVPWRDAGSTRTANRTDLLKILYPISKNPSFEVVGGRFVLLPGNTQCVCNEFGGVMFEGGLSLSVYITPISDERVVIPFHKCEGRLRFIDSGLSVNFNRVSFLPWEAPERSPSAIVYTTTEIIINGPGMAVIKTKNPDLSSAKRPLACEDTVIELTVLPVNAEIPVAITATLHPTKTPKGAVGEWKVAPPERQK